MPISGYSGYSGYSGSGISVVSGYSEKAGSAGTITTADMNAATLTTYSSAPNWFAPAGAGIMGCSSPEVYAVETDNSYRNATKYLVSDVSPTTTVNRRNVSNKYNAMEFCRKK